MDRDIDGVRFFLYGMVAPFVRRIDVMPEEIRWGRVWYRVRVYTDGVEPWHEALFDSTDLWEMAEVITRHADWSRWVQDIPTDINVASLEVWMKDRDVSRVELLYRGDLMEGLAPFMIEVTVYKRQGAGVRAVLKLDHEWVEKLTQWTDETNQRWEQGRSAEHKMKSKAPKGR